MTYSGLEALVVPWLASTLGVRCVTETPSDLQAQVPLHRVYSAGGVADPGAPAFINPRLATDTFAGGYAATAQAFEDLKNALLARLPGQTINGCTVTRVELQGGPVWIGYPDTAIRQFSSTFNLWINTR